MRGVIVLISAATLIALVATSQGASPGNNKFRALVEVIMAASAMSAITILRGSRRFRGVAAVVLFLMISALLALGLPGGETVRRAILAPFMPGRERGFVLAALGRPEFVSDGIGTAAVYGYRAAWHADESLVLRFSISSTDEDAVETYSWAEEGEAIVADALHPPGPP
jgi:ABC-type transport system involved in multi-copper enzyme maturation permease subunit